MIYHFEDYSLDEERHELRHAGEAVPIEPRVFQVLLYLLEHRDRVVSKAELFEQCWPDTFVTESALTRCMTKLRRAVGTPSGTTEVIKTVHRQGYRFVVEVEVTEGVDLDAPAAQPIPSSEPPALAPERPEPPGPIILVVEDEPTNRELLERQLHRCGYATRSATNGQEALDQVAAEAPDLILLDVRMPVLDGFAVCRQLKTQPASRWIPIILLTALDQPQDRHSGLEAGADAFLTKPIDRQELLARIETALSPPPSAARPSSETGLDPEDPETPVAPSPLLSFPASEPAPTAPAERRQLTLLSCTLSGAAELAGHLDAEALHDVLRTFHRTCAEIVAPFDGQIAQHLDDGLLVYFGYPQAHEDDAQRAVRSGLALTEAMRQGALADWGLPGTPLALRVGIATGMMIVTPGATADAPPALGVGNASSLAVRLGALAPPGTVVISEATARLVAGYFECKGLEEAGPAGAPEPLRGYEVLSQSPLQTRLEVESAEGLTAFVGREAEVALLRERWTDVQEGLGQAILIQGEAGTGKSRLVQVLKEQVAGELTLTLEGRCSPYHQNTALYPLIDLTQRVLQGASVTSSVDRLERLEGLLARSDIALEETVPLLAELLSLPLPEGRYAPLSFTPRRQRERTLEVLVSFFLVQAAQSPLLVVVEDVHWSDPSTLEFLHLLMEQVATSSILVVLTSRPGFAPPWTLGAEMMPVAVLGRLTQGQTVDMITQVAGKPLPAAVMQQLVEKTDGMPLFVEELTRMVVESDQLVERDGQYELSGELAELTVPVTLHDSLMARLDRLGSAKEMAQWGSVLGREFSYEVLEAVTPYDEAVLRGGLTQLVGAGLLHQRGRPPKATYLFKHALIQDAAYASLLRSTRQHMHEQIAQQLEERFCELVAVQPELVAHHHTEAGQAEQAIGYWQQAGQRASEHSAYQEAMSHLTTALTLLQSLPETLARHQQELPLQIALGTASLVVRGPAAPEVETAYMRARVLCQELGDTQDVFPVLWGLYQSYMVRGDLPRARPLGEDLLGLAERRDEAPLYVVAHLALGNPCFRIGELLSARRHLEAAIARDTPGQPRPPVFGTAEDPGVICRGLGAWTLWLLGYPDQALGRAHEALRLATELAHHYSCAYALNMVARLCQFRRQEQDVSQHAEAAVTLSIEQGFRQWLMMGTILQGWALTARGQREEGLAQMRQGFAGSRAAGAELNASYYLSLLAEGYGVLDQVEAGLDALKEAFEVAERTGIYSWNAEVHRRRGELLLHQTIPDVAQAESCFHQALDIARQQQAKSLELRAATSLARLWQRQNKRKEAHDLLAPVYNWFTEGFDTADLIEAQQLVDELSIDMRPPTA
ncbi:response regulator [Candidatus Entotheonella palauensis]|uniref:response regulator n=1 Tax=Candidatus Entotheonella palauensis TaxID=93172 RepID=UPI000B7C664E|nr:response regulator [Candidatus Entotheonella palauensis]